MGAFHTEGTEGTEAHRVRSQGTLETIDFFFSRTHPAAEELLARNSRGYCRVVMWGWFGSEEQCCVAEQHRVSWEVGEEIRVTKN